MAEQCQEALGASCICVGLFSALFFLTMLYIFFCHELCYYPKCSTMRPWVLAAATHLDLVVLLGLYTVRLFSSQMAISIDVQFHFAWHCPAIFSFPSRRLCSALFCFHRNWHYSAILPSGLCNGSTWHKRKTSFIDHTQAVGHKHFE